MARASAGTMTLGRTKRCGTARAAVLSVPAPAKYPWATLCGAERSIRQASSSMHPTDATTASRVTKGAPDPSKWQSQPTLGCFPCKAQQPWQGAWQIARLNVQRSKRIHEPLGQVPHRAGHTNRGRCQVLNATSITIRGHFARTAPVNEQDWYSTLCEVSSAASAHNPRADYTDW